MKRVLTMATTTCCLFSLSHSAQADFSLTATAVSDYSFNGISQTGSDPALQVSLDYAGKNGFYAGAWTSNVDFGSADKTSQEIDYYIGNYWQLNEKIGLDAGIAYYTYHGASNSGDFDSPEAYAKLGFNSSLGDSELNFWYTNDYFGLGGDHYTAMVAHTFQVAEGHNIRLSYDRSTSGDEDKWAWGGSENDSYDHYRAEYSTSWKGLALSLAVEDTNDIDEAFDADSRVVFSVGKTFSFK